MIRYSGSTIVDTTFVSDGTKSQYMAQVGGFLMLAGWVLISAGIYESATTPSGQKIRVEIYDGGGTSVRFRLRSLALTHPTPAFAFPLTGRTFRVWANKYQFFIFFSGTVFTSDPSDVAVGVPWMPDFVADLLSDPYAGYMAANGLGDPGDPKNQNTQNTFHGWFNVWYNSPGFIWDGVAVDCAITATDFIQMIGQEYSLGNGDLGGVWEDGSIALYEPYITWPSGHTAVGNWSNQTRHGQLWDALAYGAQLQSEVILIIGGQRWRNLTHKVNPGGNRILHSHLLLTN